MESQIKFIEGNKYFTDEEIEYVIDIFAPKNRVLLLDAREGAGKTKLLLTMSFSVCTGNDFLGQKSHKGNVMWLNLDRMFNNDLRERCRELGHDDLDWVDRMHWYDGSLDLAKDSEFGNSNLEELIKYANDNKISLIVFDTLAALFVSSKMDEMSAADAEELMMQLIIIARSTQACVVALHHMPKDRENFGARGSTAIAAKCDLELYLDPDSDMAEEVTLDVKKSRTHNIQIFPVKIDANGFSYAREVDELTMGAPEGAWAGLLSKTKITTSQLDRDIEWLDIYLLKNGYRGGEFEIYMDHTTILLMFDQINSESRISKVIDSLKEDKRATVKKSKSGPQYWLKFTEEQMEEWLVNYKIRKEIEKKMSEIEEEE